MILTLVWSKTDVNAALDSLSAQKFKRLDQRVGRQEGFREGYYVERCDRKFVVARFKTGDRRRCDRAHKPTEQGGMAWRVIDGRLNYIAAESVARSPHTPTKPNPLGCLIATEPQWRFLRIFDLVHGS